MLFGVVICTRYFGSLAWAGFSFFLYTYIRVGWSPFLVIYKKFTSLHITVPFVVLGYIFTLRILLYY